MFSQMNSPARGEEEESLDKVRLCFDLERFGGLRVANFLSICNNFPKTYSKKADGTKKQRRYQILVRNLKRNSFDEYIEFLTKHSIPISEETLR